MKNQLSDAEYAGVLSCVETIYQCPDLDHFPSHTLKALRNLIKTHLCGYNEVNLKRGRIVSIIDPVITEFSPLVPVFEKLMHQHPVITYFDRTGDGQALKISDFLGAREYHQKEIYRDVYRHMAVEDQIAVGVRLEPGFIIGIAMARRDRSFSEKDRTRLNLVRPHLVQAYLRVAEVAENREQNQDLGTALSATGRGLITLNESDEIIQATPGAMECLARFLPPPRKMQPSRLPPDLVKWARREESAEMFVKIDGPAKLVVRRVRSGGRLMLLLSEDKTGAETTQFLRSRLTQREMEVLTWVAQGKANSEIASILRVTLGTVKLHVEHILAKLGVENRTAAALLARGTGL
jgi:DNA-binding CsgD family transcriptional regulator